MIDAGSTGHSVSMRGMTQLNLNPSRTPASLNIDVSQDPFDDSSVMAVRAVVYNQARHVLTAHQISLPGIEADYLDSVLGAIAHSFQFGDPVVDLRACMGHMKRQAIKHRQGHREYRS